MKILNDDKILDFFDYEGLKPEFNNEQLQVVILYPCKCSIRQDDKGNWLFPCNDHKPTFEEYRQQGFIHKYL
jgi:hypothetical protein